MAVHASAIAAFSFVCPRPEVGRWRLGIMGALPTARGTGAAPALLDDFIDRARGEGLTWVELECFAENERALRLYRSRGFEPVDALDGWKAPEPAALSPAVASAGDVQAVATAGDVRAVAPAGDVHAVAPAGDVHAVAPAGDVQAVAPAGDVRAVASAGDVQAVDRASALAWLDHANRRLAWLPFPNSDRCMAAQVRPLTFWRRGTAQVAFSVVEGTPTQIHSLIDLDPGLRDAETLARALLAAHPDAFAPPILRAVLGAAALGRAGYVRHGMSQVLMKRRL